MSERVFTPQEITKILVREFAASLIISASGLILYGIDSYKFLIYLSEGSQRDPHLTKVYISVVMIVTTASAFYSVYFNWSLSITGFTEGATSQIGHVNGYAVVLYSGVVTLVQLFWLVVLDSALQSQPKLWRWSVTSLIGLGSICSFLTSVSVAACSAIFGTASWPDSTISILLRITLGLDLGVDSTILIAILPHLHRMRMEFKDLNRAFSKLTYVFCGTGLVSTMVIIVELVINSPSDGENTLIPITFTFFPVLGPLYAFSMLSVLNSRATLRLEGHDNSSTNVSSGQDRSLQMNFMNDAISASVADSQEGSNASIQSGHWRDRAESRAGLSERKNQKRFCKTQVETELTSGFSEIGIETI